MAPAILPGYANQMNDFLSHLAATTLNLGEAIQPRLPSRFESLRQRVGPIDIRPADLEPSEMPPVSDDAGADSAVAWAEPPPAGLATSIAREPTATAEQRALEMEAAASSTKSGPRGPSAMPPSHRGRQRQRPEPSAPARPTPVQQGTAQEGRR
jgi:hypothetical protein